MVTTMAEDSVHPVTLNVGVLYNAMAVAIQQAASDSNMHAVDSHKPSHRQVDSGWQRYLLLALGVTVAEPVIVHCYCHLAACWIATARALDKTPTFRVTESLPPSAIVVTMWQIM